jgi:hypothetical protein
MYASAFASGFRTAFVNFDMPGGKSQDMWFDGETLARQITDVCGFYKTPRVILVAHSKGGVDAQTAAVHFGAENLVERIITLSTPHFGSQLADIAYSTKGFALAELIGAHSSGCFSMQTGYMQRYRYNIDESPNNTSLIQTFSGNGTDAEFTRIWAGSLFLDRYGENDGVVTVKSSHNPKGENLGTLHFNHAQMGDGKFVWTFVDSAIRGYPQQTAIQASALPVCAPPAQIIKGGSLIKGINESFHVDGTVEYLNLCISLAGIEQPQHFRLFSPDGKKVLLTTQKSAAGTLWLCASVNHPQVGKWKLTAAQSRGAYCAFISLRGANVCHTFPEGTPTDQIGADLRILRTYADGYDVVGEYSIKNGIFMPDLPRLDNGIYNVEMNLTSELDDGSTFERTIISPIAQGNDVRELLAKATGNVHDRKGKRRR